MITQFDQRIDLRADDRQCLLLQAETSRLSGCNRATLSRISSARR